MFAKTLEGVLASVLADADLSRADNGEISARFDSLRSYGQLPRGRGNRARRLTPSEISAAIFGLVPSKAFEAGLGAKILGDLRPVGGVAASFYAAPTLSDSMALLLADPNARTRFIKLVLSLAEIATNSYGFATLVFEKDGKRCQVSFTSKMALTLMQAGAELTFDADLMHTPALKCVVLNRHFFEQIASAVERSIAYGKAPEGDGREYDAEEAKQARLLALGATTQSRYLSIAVDTQVTWPKTEMLIEFDRYQLVLLPRTKDHTQSVHIDTRAHRLTDVAARTVINRFLSILAWCDDQHAVAQGGWSGSHVPSPMAKRSLAFATAHVWPFQRSIPPSDDACRALALYRDGLNSEAAELAGYAVLSYYKIIEIKHPEGPQTKEWIAANFKAATKAASSDGQMKHFAAACGDSSPQEYIYKACRIAVAHASTKQKSDIDDATELTRLFTASFVLRLLARHFIRTEFKVSTSILSEKLGRRDRE